jgi:hypothetical protein
LQQIPNFPPPDPDAAGRGGEGMATKSELFAFSYKARKCFYLILLIENQGFKVLLQQNPKLGLHQPFPSTTGSPAW